MIVISVALSHTCSRQGREHWISPRLRNGPVSHSIDKIESRSYATQNVSKTASLKEQYRGPTHIINPVRSLDCCRVHSSTAAVSTSCEVENPVSWPRRSKRPILRHA